jgi:hypothetical protein
VGFFDAGGVCRGCGKRREHEKTGQAGEQSAMNHGENLQLKK